MSTRSLLSCGSAALAVVLAVACADQPPTAPVEGAKPAKAAGTGGSKGGTGGGGGGGTGPTVTATDPDSAAPNTTLDVQVLGSGFDAGSQAVWGLNCESESTCDTTFATTRIKTNSTRFVNETRLIANITIEPDAPLDVYDVQVLTSGGKKGIGIELFTVTYEVLPATKLDFQAKDINEGGWVAGTEFLSRRSGGGSRPILWIPRAPRGRTGDATYLEVLPSARHSGALALNDAGQVVGYSGPPEALLWESGGMQKLEGGWGGKTVTNPELGKEHLIGGGDPSDAQAVVWRVSGTGPGFQVVGRDLLPSLSGGRGLLFGLNETGVAVGWEEVGGFPKPVRWYRSGGGWTVSALSLPAGGTRGEARGINSAGTIVGWHDLSNGSCPISSQGLVWTPGSPLPQALPDLAGGTCSRAFAINDFGLIAGVALDKPVVSGYIRPVLWVPVGGKYSALRLDLSGSPNALNEPEPDFSGARVVQVVGETITSGRLWTVKVP